MKEIGLRNITFYYKLYLEVISNNFISISFNEDKLVIIKKFYYKYKDYDVIYFFNIIKINLDIFIYRDYTSIAYYLTYNSIKLFYIADFVY